MMLLWKSFSSKLEQKRFSKAPNSQLEFQPHIASFIKYLADQLSFD